MGDLEPNCKARARIRAWRFHLLFEENLSKPSELLAWYMMFKSLKLFPSRLVAGCRSSPLRRRVLRSSACSRLHSTPPAWSGGVDSERCRGRGDQARAVVAGEGVGDLIGACFLLPKKCGTTRVWLTEPDALRLKRLIAGSLFVRGVLLRFYLVPCSYQLVSESQIPPKTDNLIFRLVIVNNELILI